MLSSSLNPLLIRRLLQPTKLCTLPTALTWPYPHAQEKKQTQTHTQSVRDSGEWYRGETRDIKRVWKNEHRERGTFTQKTNTQLRETQGLAWLVMENINWITQCVVSVSVYDSCWNSCMPSRLSACEWMYLCICKPIRRWTRGPYSATKS